MANHCSILPPNKGYDLTPEVEDQIIKLLMAFQSAANKTWGPPASIEERHNPDADRTYPAQRGKRNAAKAYLLEHPNALVKDIAHALDIDQSTVQKAKRELKTEGSSGAEGGS